MISNIRDRYEHEVAQTVAVNIVIALIGAVTGIMLARYLGPEGRGWLAAIQLWPAIILYVSPLGIGDALTYYSSKKAVRAGSYLGAATLFSSVSAIPLVVVAWLLLPRALSSQPAEVVAAARTYLMIVWAHILILMAFNSLRGATGANTWNKLRLPQPLFWLITIIACILMGRISARELSIAFLLVSCLLGVCIAIWTRWRLGGLFTMRMKEARELLHYGFPAFGGQIPQLLSRNIDQVILAALMAPQALGVYVVGASWGAILAPLLSATSLLMLPRVACRHSVGDKVAVLSRVTRILAPGSVLLTAPVMIITPFLIVLLYGAGYSASIPVALIMLCAAAVTTISANITEGLRGIRNFKLVAVSEWGGVALSTITMLGLVRSFGPMGAAIGVLVGRLGGLAVALAGMRREYSCDIRSLLIPNPADIADLKGRLIGIWKHG